MIDTWQIYFQYLCQKIGLGQKLEYTNIIEMLFNKNFFWSVQHDVNRSFDGTQWRHAFMNDTEYVLQDYELGREAKVLEVLTALADRMSFIIYDPHIDLEPNLPRSFWLLIDNLDLKPRKNGNDIKVDKWLRREYSPSGVGGLFPLSEWVKKDQRTVELWYQMMDYIEEKGYI